MWKAALQCECIHITQRREMFVVTFTFQSNACNIHASAQYLHKHTQIPAVRVKSTSFRYAGIPETELHSSLDAYTRRLLATCCVFVVRLRLVDLTNCLNKTSHNYQHSIYNPTREHGHN